MNMLIAKITTRNEPAGMATTVSLALAMVLLLSLAGCTVQLGQAQQIDPHAGGISVPVHVLHYESGATLVLLAVTINNHGPYTFIVDTGAEVSLIDTQVSRILGLRVKGAAHQVSGIGGSQEAVPVAISNWHADKLRLPNMAIDSGDFSAERRASGYVGLFGSDILTQFGLISIDYAHSTLTVYKQIA
ncbi:MAG: retropepsin-like aspartic protease [Ktedonobacterales bacterium]